MSILPPKHREAEDSEASRWGVLMIAAAFLAIPVLLIEVSRKKERKKGTKEYLASSIAISSVVACGASVSRSASGRRTDSRCASAVGAFHASSVCCRSATLYLRVEMRMERSQRQYGYSSTQKGRKRKSSLLTDSFFTFFFRLY